MAKQFAAAPSLETIPSNSRLEVELIVGPTCEVLLKSDDESTLRSIDEILAKLADRIDRTRKGRVWSIWIRGHPVHVQIDQSVVALSAGCNCFEDAIILRELAECIVQGVGGISSTSEE